jgi:ribosome-binding factor A
MSRRTDRVNELLREELGELIQLRVRDPRVEGRIVSITEVDVSPDLRHANVFVSCLEFSDTPEAVLGLQHSAAFLHQELGHRLHMRSIPKLTFRVDPSLERGARLASLIREVSGPDGPTA